MFQYKIIPASKRSKKISLSVNEEGILIIRAPKYTLKYQIEKLINQHKNWIEKQISTAKKVNKNYKQNAYYIFGKEYTLSTFSTVKKRPFIKLNEEASVLEVYSKTPLSINEQKKLIKNFYKTLARSYFIQRLELYSLAMKLKPNKLFIKSQKSLWGSCSSKNNINLNLKLLVYPKEIIDYVIIHELAHIKHKNHKKEFWDLVKLYYPDYKNAKRQLKNKLMRRYAEKI